MKYKLKTLFVITILIALLFASYARDRHALNEVGRLKAVVNTTLAEMDGLNQDDVRKSDFRSEYILFSWGNLAWDVELDEESKPTIEWNGNRSRYSQSIQPSF